MSTETGIVESVSHVRGCGIIRAAADNQECFFHMSQVGYALRVGERVTFTCRKINGVFTAIGVDSPRLSDIREERRRARERRATKLALLEEQKLRDRIDRAIEADATKRAECEQAFAERDVELSYRS
jgi:cold shock CspA family protein